MPEAGGGPAGVGAEVLQVPFIERVDFEAVAEWAAAGAVAASTVTVSCLYVYLLVTRHPEPIRAALLPVKLAVWWAASLGAASVFVYGAWAIYDGWGLGWLLAWLLGPPGAAAVVRAALLFVRSFRSSVPRHLQMSVWRWRAYRRHKALRKRKANRRPGNASAKRAQRARDERARRSVARYLLWRDSRLCGGCGNETTSKAAYVANIVPEWFGNFDVDANGMANRNGTWWNADKDNIDNVQAACNARCRSAGRDTAMWRHPLLVRLPVASERARPGNHLWLPP